MKLSGGQKKVAAEILGNTAVAWFSIGFISPLLLGPSNIIAPTLSLSSGFVLSGLFVTFALILVRKVKS